MKSRGVRVFKQVVFYVFNLGNRQKMTLWSKEHCAFVMPLSQYIRFRQHSVDKIGTALLRGQAFEQAVRRRSELGNPSYNKVLTSHADRACLTGRHIASENSRIFIMPALYGYDPEDHPSLFAKTNEAFAKLKYAPYKDYLAHEHGNVFVECGQKMWEAVREIIGDAGRTLVVSHAVIMNAMGIAAIGDNPGVARVLEELAFEECEGYRLTFDGTKFLSLVTHQG
jgi:broad specificity phosphatase PhoE